MGAIASAELARGYATARWIAEDQFTSEIEMPSTASLLGFFTAALLILLTPGPGVLYILARSLSQGRKAGLVSVLGLAVGALAHVLAATAGLSALLLASATAFGVVKALGAGYLIYLGLRTIFASSDHGGSGGGGTVTRESARSARRLFTDGVVVSVLNPKIAIFFLAFLPQFVDPGRGSGTLQVLVLGLLYVLLALITDGAYALLASALRHRLHERALHGPFPRYATGAVYIGLGVSSALAGRRP